MLEQAIIDAGALKEAATKNAETLVLEKYSHHIKEAVESLLEQDDPAAAMGDLMGADSPTDDPLASPAMAEDPAASPDLEAPVEKSSVLEHIPLGVTAEDEEKIEIPLDKLTEELAALNESFRFGGDSHNISELFEHNLAEIEDDTLEEILAEEEDDDSETEEFSDEAENPVAEEVDLEEELLSKIMEKLVVDVAGPNKSGWAGTPTSEVELAEEELLALEQDSERREHRAAVNSALSKLEKVNESLNGKNKKLEGTLSEATKQILKSKEIILTLKDKLEESNLTNAKLLYQNKALTDDSLNERQKNKLVEAVSNAETIEEAKVIFETLQSTVGSTSRKSQPKSLSEAVQKPSSMILSAARRNSGERQKQSPTLNRWKTLAGIDK